MVREIELKFAVHPAFSLDAIAGSAGVAAITGLDPLNLSATYYDTPDLRLARSGVTLRYRTGELAPGWTVKFPLGGSGIVREELVFDGPAEQIPQDALDVVAGYTRSAAMGAVATLTTKRDRWILKDDAGKDLAVVYQDEVSVVEDGRTLTRFREIELESVGVGVRRLRKIGAAFEAAGAVTTEPVPKAVRALGPRATAPPDVPTTFEGDTAASAVQALLAGAADRIMSHHAAARLGDADGVHQMRVGTRRLRSDLRTFKPLIDQAWAVPVIDDLRWLAGLLGNVRDSDVLIERLTKAATGLRSELRPMFEAFEQEVELQRAALYEGLRSARYRVLLETLVRAAQNPPVTLDAAMPTLEMVTTQVVKPWRRLVDTVDGGGRKPDDETLHEIRIRVKRVRYAAEAVAASVPEAAAPAKRFAKEAGRLQDVLGEYNDAVVAEAKLRELATRPDTTTDFVVALGQLIERQHRIKNQARKEWRLHWRALKRAKNTKWLP